MRLHCKQILSASRRERFNLAQAQQEMFRARTGFVDHAKRTLKSLTRFLANAILAKPLPEELHKKNQQEKIRRTSWQAENAASHPGGTAWSCFDFG
jgi:hypothetical protein